ncbi:hypothetical protein F5887DRAFT_1159792 [Amanita rubescens]|nr:hypothetical protein F5887DRAFT_1159792 [Amanita rubescens]
MASPHSAYPYIVYPPYFQYPQPGSSSPRRPQNRSPHPLYPPPYPLQHGRQQQQQHYPPFNHHPHPHPQYYHQPQHQHQHQQWQPQPQPLLPVTPTDLEHQKDVDPPPIPAAPSPTPPTPTPIEVTKNVYTITGTIPISTVSSSHASPVIQSTLLSPQPDSDEKSSNPPTTQQKEPQPQPQPPTHKLKSSWAIWSRRPTDPSNAPAIIISPQAHPPPDVIQQALDIRTPPPSPPPLPSVTLPVVGDEDMAEIEVKEKVAAVVEEEKHEENGNESESENGVPQVAAAVATDSSTVPSSATSVIDNSTSSTVPGSPATSTTSVSLPAVVGNGTIPFKADEDVLDEKSVASTTAEAEEAVLTTSASTTAAAAAASTSTETAETPTAVTTTTTTTSPPPAPPPKKSWASLLKSSESSSSASGSGRNALPTSNVVGISIPASIPSHQYAFGEPSSSGTTAHEKNKADLIALLSGGGNLPAAATATTTTTIPTTIRPRGLVNSGNMCFANAVLQMLVYTPPVQKLFVELGRLKGDKEKTKGSDKTPLVDAMIEFIKDFVVDDVRLVNGHALANGWGGGGKGKEKERQWEDGNQGGGEDEGMWEGESFIPTYVYDALKEKKRFDNMRGGQQEDAEEFLGFLLETLEEELVVLREEVTGRRHTLQAPSEPAEEKEEAAPPEELGWQEVGKRNRTVVTRTIQSTETPISKMFGGKFRTTLRVPYAKKDSVIVEDWRSVRLDIQRDQTHTVQDALSYISHPQPVQVTHPGRPGTTLEAQQLVHIDALPPILVLHMKRFCYDTNVGGVVKVGKQVRFGPELDISNDVLAPGIRKSWSPKYKLFGVLYHHGLSASGGHYTLDVLHPTRYAGTGSGAVPAWGGTGVGGGVKGREGWVRIDDELVSDVRHEDVFGAWERDESRSAYLLFYKRVR